MINQRYGLPLMFLATDVVFSNEQRWEIITNEIRQVAWVQVGPTGIPRTGSWRKTSERGGTTRYKQYFSMPNEVRARNRRDSLNWAAITAVVH